MLFCDDVCLVVFEDVFEVCFVGYLDGFVFDD